VTTRRKTTCPQGRPLWRSDEIPDTLATVTRLRLMRRRLAPGQAPAATLLYQPPAAVGPQYTPLYEIAATVQLPPLPPVQQARWVAARTCNRCGTLGQAPLPVLDDGRRRCSGCLEAEACAGWWQRQNVRRLQGSAWAREVLADPAAVLVAEHNKEWDAPLQVAFRRPGMPPFLAAVLPYRLRERASEFPDAAAADVYRGEIEQLGQARRIGWTEHPLYRLTEQTHWYEWGWPVSLRVDAADTVLERYSAWLGDRPAGLSYRESYLLAGHGGGRGDYRWVDRLTANSAGEITNQMHNILQRMAADAHPAGPLTCPTIGTASTTPCGDPAVLEHGLCASHRAAILRRPLTPPAPGPDGYPQHMPQRTCDGCGAEIGDATAGELAAAMLVDELPDARPDCPTCTPVVAP
jgi:hypothetical protein